MAISLRQIVTGVNSGAAASVNIGAGTLSTDVLLAIGYSDFYTLATGSGFGPPSGGGWTQVTNGTADLGTDNSKVRTWTKTAAAGAATITLAPIVDEDVALAVLVLAGADTSNPVDTAGAQTSTGAGSPSLHVAPSISPATADAFLVSAAGTSVFNGGAAYTSPGTMTERAEFSTPGNTTTHVVATQQLAASGATGTRTFSYGGNNDPGVAVSVAIRTAVTDVNLTVADATQAQAADNVVITQTHQLAVNDAAQAQTADNVAITQVHQLVVQDASHAQTADNVTLTQTHQLVVADASQAQTADNVALTQVHQLVVADATQAQAADNVDIVQVVQLVVADASQAQVADNVTLTQVHQLVVADATQAQTAESVTLSEGQVLVVQDAAQSQTADNVSLTQVHGLVVNDATQAQAADNVTLSQVHVLVVQDATQAQTADNVVLQLPGVRIPELSGTATVIGLTGTARANGLTGTVTA